MGGKKEGRGEEGERKGRAWWDRKKERNSEKEHERRELAIEPFLNAVKKQTTRVVYHLTRLVTLNTDYIVNLYTQSKTHFTPPVILSSSFNPVSIDLESQLPTT